MQNTLKAFFLTVLVLGGLGSLAYIALGATSTFNNPGVATSTFNNSLPIISNTSSRWYTFDGQNTTGVTTADMSGNNVSAVGIGSYTFDVGKVGQGIRFTGSTAAQKIFTTPMANTSTVMFWIRPDTLTIPSAHRMAFTGDGTGSGATYISLQTDGVAAPFVSYRIGGTQRTLSSGVASTVGQYVHVAVTWDGSFLKIYTDCTLRATSANLSGTGVINGMAGGNGRIGSYDSNGFETVGVIDDFRIYPVALTAAEIAPFCTAFTTITTSTP